MFCTGVLQSTHVADKIIVRVNNCYFFLSVIGICHTFIIYPFLYVVFYIPKGQFTQCRFYRAFTCTVRRECRYATLAMTWICTVYNVHSLLKYARSSNWACRRVFKPSAKAGRSDVFIQLFFFKKNILAVRIHLRGWLQLGLTIFSRLIFIV